MNKFGIIHDLADVEIRVRRELMTALHEVHCSRRLVIDNSLLNNDEHQQLEAMLLRAETLIQNVIGA